MSENETKPPPDSAALWQNWTTIWQSELAAMATDPEIAETLARSTQLTTQLWAQMTQSLQASVREEHHEPKPRTGTPARSAPAAAAPDAGRDDIARLEQRIAQLERRLDALAAPVPARRRLKPKP